MARAGVGRHHDGRLIREVYRGFIVRGFRPPEAANLTAVIVGLPLCKTPWTVYQIATIVVLRRQRLEGSSFVVG